MTTIAMTKFARGRHTKESQYSYFDGHEYELLALVYGGFNHATPGYRDGVILVPVAPDGFYSSTIQLKEGDKLAGEFSARREGEDPRKHVWVVDGEKIPAKRVEIVLYSHETLAEDNDNEADADWEIVSINACPTTEEQPIPPGTLLANHFGLSGGTDTKMSAEELVAELAKRVPYWADKAPGGK